MPQGAEDDRQDFNAHAGNGIRTTSRVPRLNRLLADTCLNHCMSAFTTTCWLMSEVQSSGDHALGGSGAGVSPAPMSSYFLPVLKYFEACKRRHAIVAEAQAIRGLHIRPIEHRRNESRVADQRGIKRCGVADRAARIQRRKVHAPGVPTRVQVP